MTPEFANYMEKAKDAIFDSLALILGVTGDAAENMIHFSWPTASGSERFTAGPMDDICYIRMSQVNKPANGYINTRYEGIGNQSLLARKDMHLALRADYIFYGPHSAEYAVRLYMMIHTPEVRDILKQAHMAPIPHKDTPMYVPELVDGNWYERSDAGIDFYMLMQYSGTVEAMVNAPEIVIAQNE